MPVLESLTKNQFGSAIRLFRTVKVIRLRDAKTFVENLSLPARVPFRTTAECADGLVRFYEPGFLRIDPDLTRESAPVPLTFTFHVVAYLEFPTDDDWESDDTPPPPEGCAAFLAFVVAALGVTEEKAAELAGASYSVTLVSKQDYQLAQIEQERYQTLLPPADPAREWNIALGVSLHLPQAQ